MSLECSLYFLPSKTISAVRTSLMLKIPTNISKTLNQKFSFPEQNQNKCSIVSTLHDKKQHLCVLLNWYICRYLFVEMSLTIFFVFERYHFALDCTSKYVESYPHLEVKPNFHLYGIL